MIDKDLLKNAALDFGVLLDDMALDRFELLEQRLVRWNNHINLTAITEPDEIVIKHFVDSLSIFSAVDCNWLFFISQKRTLSLYSLHNLS